MRQRQARGREPLPTDHDGALRRARWWQDVSEVARRHLGTNRQRPRARCSACDPSQSRSGGASRPVGLCCFRRSRRWSKAARSPTGRARSGAGQGRPRRRSRHGRASNRGLTPDESRFPWRRRRSGGPPRGFSALGHRGLRNCPLCDRGDLAPTLAPSKRVFRRSKRGARAGAHRIDHIGPIPLRERSALDCLCSGRRDV
jgi:hypothetical protein